MNEKELLEEKGREANHDLNFRQWGASKHQQYFTPLALSQTIFEVLSTRYYENFQGKQGHLRILDPTCGIGRLLYPWQQVQCQVIGIELDKIIASKAKMLLGSQNVRDGSILDYTKYLKNSFDLVVTNPPYGLWWNQEQTDNYEFENTCYGGQIESQTATLDICLSALSSNGLLIAIIPSSTFENTKDNHLRELIYHRDNRVLCHYTIENLFKKEYGIEVKTDILFVRNYCDNWQRMAGDKEPCKFQGDYETKGFLQEFKINLVSAFAGEKIEIPSYCKNLPAIPYLTNLNPLKMSNQLDVLPHGVTGNLAAMAMLDFQNIMVKDYNPVKGQKTGIKEVYLSLSGLIKQGTDKAINALKPIGYDLKIDAKTTQKLAQLKKKYDKLSTPLYPPQPHQLLAYFEEREYRAKETVKDREGLTIFLKNKNYSIRPTWNRNMEEIMRLPIEKNGKPAEQVISIDRGYLVFQIETEQGERTFQEPIEEDMILFLKAFDIPEIKAIGDKYPGEVKGYYRKAKALGYFDDEFDYQAQDLARLAVKPFGYLGYEMGGGKSISGLSYVLLRGYKKTLIICQAGLVKNWLAEGQKFGIEINPILTHASITHLQAQKRANVKPVKPQFYVTSYEFLSLDTGRVFKEWECIKHDKDGNIIHQVMNNAERCGCGRQYLSAIKECPKCQKALKNYECDSCGYSVCTYDKKKQYPAYKRLKKLFSCIIIDEAQLAKTRNSDRGRAVRALKSKSHLLLTGTLMKGYITDTFHNIGWCIGHDNPLFPYSFNRDTKRFLDEFGTYEFCSTQFGDTLSEGRAKLIPEVSNLNRFWKILGSFTIRRLKSDMVKLPPKYRKLISLDMPQEQQAYYDDLAEKAKKAIDRELRKSNEEVNMGVISKHLWNLRFAATIPSDLSLDQNPKLNKIVEICRQVQAQGEKAIIFSGLREMQKAIVQRLTAEGIENLSIFASVSPPKRLAKINDFSTNGHIALVAGLNVLNRGFTITAANHVIITDIEYSPEATEQAEDRSHRTGQEKPVNIYYLFADGTIDQDIYRKIRQKQAAIGNAIDMKARFETTADLLKKASCNIQLELAKDLIKGKPAEAQKSIPWLKNIN